MSERAVDLIKEYHVDFAVLGADAVDPHAITNTNSFEVPMKRAMIRSADKVLLVADSSKFGQSALVRVAELHDIDLVITDDGLDEETAASYPVEILRVPVLEEDPTPEFSRGLGRPPRPDLEPAILAGDGPRARTLDRMSSQ
jgi:DeoR family transcriptional regulator, aga operon transcriptional repressor